MTKAQKNIASPTVLMLMGTQCAYCGPMMQMLTELMKAGSISELRIVNIEKDQDLAKKLGVRSVPWLQIGPFELQGSHSKQELMMWLERASSFSGVSDYLAQVLAEGNIDFATRLIERYPQALKNVLQLMADPEAKINVRLGVGVIIEGMAESSRFETVIPQLIDYLSHKDARVRGDACHYLSLTKNSAYIPLIEKLLSDESEEVREIAQDSLDELAALVADSQ
jgi:thioredoxin-like negative regulator of GroEL